MRDNIIVLGLVRDRVALRILPSVIGTMPQHAERQLLLFGSPALPRLQLRPSRAFHPQAPDSFEGAALLVALPPDWQVMMHGSVPYS